MLTSEQMRAASQSVQIQKQQKNHNLKTYELQAVVT